MAKAVEQLHGMTCKHSERFGLLVIGFSWHFRQWRMWSGLNFINVLRTAFTLVDPKSVKRHWWLNCILYAFGIYEHKTVCRTLMKLTPDVVNVPWTNPNCQRTVVSEPRASGNMKKNLKTTFFELLGLKWILMTCYMVHKQIVNYFDTFNAIFKFFHKNSIFWWIFIMGKTQNLAISATI